MPQLTKARPPIIFILVFVVVLAATYALALPGYFLFDDIGNLEGLAQVADLRSWLTFVTAGEAGPLGRPVSLASFALQSGTWPDDTASLLQVNIGIHVLNTFLVFLLAMGLASIRKPSETANPLWIGLLTAMLWAASPFLANSSLLIIQRMATLAGFFMFAGLTAFVWAHHESVRAPPVRWSLLALFAACIPLAAFSKENGALLPVLAALIYLVWIPRQNRHPGIAERGFYLVFVAIPAAAVLLYIASRVPEIISSGYGPRRHFTPEERLLSQPLILWDYVRNLLIPRAASAAPFTDHWPGATGFLSPPGAGIALFAWIAVIGAAVALWNKARWLIFGIGFFLGAHLVESSVFGLELYFAHRNYVPAFGIYFGLVWALFSLPQEHLKKAITGASAYALISLLVLVQTTASWNDTFPNALAWQQEHPYSERAAQFLAQQYLNLGSPHGARKAMDDLAARSPWLARTQIMRTQFCVGEEDGFPQLVDEVVGKLKNSRLDEYAAVELVNATHDEGQRSAYCGLRDMQVIARMAEALLENHAYRDHALTRSALAYVMASAREAPVEAGKALAP